jgi:hypothetical protein
VSPAKSGATGRRRPGKTRLNRGQSKASAQFGVGRRGEKLKPEPLKAQTMRVEHLEAKCSGCRGGE